MVKVNIGVGDPHGEWFEDLEVTVNTGRTFTEVPRELLQRKGVPVKRQVRASRAIALWMIDLAGRETEVVWEDVGSHGAREGCVYRGEF